MEVGFDCLGNAGFWAAGWEAYTIEPGRCPALRSGLIRPNPTFRRGGGASEDEHEDEDDKERGGIEQTFRFGNLDGGGCVRTMAVSNQ